MGQPTIGANLEIVSVTQNALNGGECSGGSVDMYYWYWGTMAMFQMGGDSWGKWNEALKEAVVKHQHLKGSGARAGSWDPAGPWGAQDGGRVYSTALMTLCLEIYYRYDRVHGGQAARPGPR